MPSTGRILVVEDDPSICDLLVGALTDEGYEVQTCDRGADALDLLETRLPDLTLLDLQMIDMTGEEFLAACRQRDLPLTRVLLLSASAHLSRAATRLNVAGALAKPFD